MSTTVDALRLRRTLGRDQWGVPIQFGPDGWMLKHSNGTTTAIVSNATHNDGREWIHASIAHTDRDPTYDELVTLRRAVWGDSGWAYQVFAPPERHYNFHEHALHLRGLSDGSPALPDFSAPTGSV